MNQVAEFYCKKYQVYRPIKFNALYWKFEQPPKNLLWNFRNLKVFPRDSPSYSKMASQKGLKRWRKMKVSQLDVEVSFSNLTHTSRENGLKICHLRHHSVTCLSLTLEFKSTSSTQNIA